MVERSIPIEKALADGLLAWDMNSEPLPLSNGGPLRLVVPGYFGVNHIKFVSRIALTDTESDAAIQANDYRMSPVGVQGAPGHATAWAMPPKSWITAPLGDASLKAGRLRVIGVAHGGNEGLARVEVTTDGGQTWREAGLFGPDLGRFAWRTFAFEFDAAPGQYVLASRATDASGMVQPEHHVPNQDGYANNSWRDPAVMIEVA